MTGVRCNVLDWRRVFVLHRNIDAVPFFFDLLNYIVFFYLCFGLEEWK